MRTCGMSTFESLESRQLLSGAVQVGPTVIITGTNSADDVEVFRVGPNGSQLTVNVGANQFAFQNSSVGNIIVNLLKGSDTLKTYAFGNNPTVKQPMLVSGGDGNDSITTGSGNDIINGDAGDDVLFGGGGKNALFGGAGEDTADYSTVSQKLVITLDGNANDGVFNFNTNTSQGDNVHTDIERVKGGSNNDKITGNNSANRLTGNGGNDSLYGLGGADIMYGGDGNDYMNGGKGNDYMDGGNGNDIMIGDSSSVHDASEYDNLFGDSGKDSIYGSNGGNSIFGGPDNDYLIGGDGNDQIDGGTGSDNIKAGAGDDEVYTRDSVFGNDTADGGLGIDIAHIDRQIFRGGLHDFVSNFETVTS